MDASTTVAPVADSSVSREQGAAFVWAGVTGIAALLVALLSAVLTLVEVANGTDGSVPLKLAAPAGSLFMACWVIAQVLLRRPIPARLESRDTYVVSGQRVGLVIAATCSVSTFAFTSMLYSLTKSVDGSLSLSRATVPCGLIAIMLAGLSATLFHYWWQSRR